MAIGQPDSDAVFAAIKRAFRDTLRLRRVDRVIHNKEINNKIIEELNAADLVIADLTYARQSVYFEAGYAEGRGIPVVYTARQDHVGKSATDDRLRVHFDLQMKNIIQWSGANRSFLRALRTRIQYVSAPLLADRRADDARKRRVDDFRRLSQHRQLELLAEIAKSYLRENAFCVTTETTQMDQYGGVITLPKWKQFRSAARLNRETLQVAYLIVSPSIRPSDLEFLRSWWRRLNPEVNLNLGGKPPKTVEATTFVCSLAPISTQTLRTAFPSHMIDDQQTIVFDSESTLLPSANLWRTSERISGNGSWYTIGDTRVDVNERGTFADRGQNRSRLGSTSKCRMEIRFRFVSRIADPLDLLTAIHETLGLSAG